MMMMLMIVVGGREYSDDGDDYSLDEREAIEGRVKEKKVEGKEKYSTAVDVTLVVIYRWWGNTLPGQTSAPLLGAAHLP